VDENINAIKHNRPFRFYLHQTVLLKNKNKTVFFFRIVNYYQIVLVAVTSVCIRYVVRIRVCVCVCVCVSTTIITTIYIYIYIHDVLNAVIIALLVEIESEAWTTAAVQDYKRVRLMHLVETNENDRRRHSSVRRTSESSYAVYTYGAINMLTTGARNVYVYMYILIMIKKRRHRVRLLTNGYTHTNVRGQSHYPSKNTVRRRRRVRPAQKHSVLVS